MTIILTGRVSVVSRVLLILLLSCWAVVSASAVYNIVSTNVILLGPSSYTYSVSQNLSSVMSGAFISITTSTIGHLLLAANNQSMVAQATSIQLVTPAYPFYYPVPAGQSISYIVLYSLESPLIITSINITVPGGASHKSHTRFTPHSLLAVAHRCCRV